MRQNLFPTTCQVCGGEGVGSIDVLNWANFVSHEDPRVCAEILKRKKSKSDTPIKEP